MDPGGPPTAVRSPAVASRRRLRAWSAALVLPAAVLAVHQLRYVLAYGSHAAARLSAHGDHYVTTATVVAGTLVAISVGLGALMLVATRRGRCQVEIGRAPLWLLWLGLTLLLLAGFCALEGVEMVLEPHRAVGVGAIFGDGGCWAVPAAAFVAALMTLLVHGGRALLVVARRRPRTRRSPVAAARHRAFDGDVRPHGPMASCAAGRAPPLTAPA